MTEDVEPPSTVTDALVPLPPNAPVTGTPPLWPGASTPESELEPPRRTAPLALADQVTGEPPRLDRTMIRVSPTPSTR